MSASPSRPGIPPRADAPVFLVGCPRSGTTLLYHALLSAGRFVRFRSESHVFNTLGPRFGGLRTAADRRAALALWLQSDNHRLTALPAAEVEQLIEEQCRHPGDFLRLIMAAMGRRQGMPRWAETTPAHLLHMPEIRAQVPGALFVHVVRDGRDVAASLARQGWVRPLPPDRDRPVLAAAAFWRWMVRRGRRDGTALGEAYCEVRYEDLLDNPIEAFATLGQFIAQPLEWLAIQRVGIGSVGNPNTSFPGAAGGFKGRWRTELTAADAGDIDAMLGPTLRTMGYPSEATAPGLGLSLRLGAYATRFAVRDWLKRHTPLGRSSTDVGLFAPGAMHVTEEKVVQAMPEGAPRSS